MCWTIFFKNFFFKQSLILSGYFLMISIWPTFANICCPYFFRKIADFKNACCFFILDLSFSDPEFSKITRMKNLWEIVKLLNQIEVNNDCQNWPNKNLSRLQLRTKFRLILERKKGDFFDRMSNGAGSWLEKTDKWSLWSTAAGDKEVEWLQLTNLGFHNRSIPFKALFFSITA